MMADVFTEEETRYLYSFKPAGFLRSWEALYASKCHAGPWAISRRHLLFGALERKNRVGAGCTTLGDDLWGWHLNIPLGFGTLALWGYRRRSG